MDARLTFDAGGLAALTAIQDPAVTAADDYVAARAKHDCASAVFDAIQEAFTANLGPAPSPLVLTNDERATLAFPGSRPRLTKPLRWAWAEKHDQDDHVQVWTEATLRFVVEHGTSIFGKDDAFAARLARWHALLPLAIEFDRRHALLADRHGLVTAREAKQEAYRAKCRAERVLNTSVATSLEGLAAIVRHVGSFEIDKMPSAWLALFVSAANVCGASIDVPPFDVQRWMQELEAAGGKACPPSDQRSAGVSFPVRYGDDPFIPTISRLAHEYEANRLAIRLYLEKMETQA